MRVSRTPSIFDGPNRWVDPADPRHVGRVVKLDGHTNVATVEWLETGWLSVLPLGKLERVPARWVPGLGHVAD